MLLQLPHPITVMPILLLMHANNGVKGIFCEKPMATSVEDAKRMLDASEKNGTYLSIDHTRRWQPLWRHTKDEVVDGGQIGDVRYVIGTLSGGPRNAIPKWHTLC